MTTWGLIALGVIWLLLPLWLVGSIYLGWLVVGTLERQTCAMEDLVNRLKEYEAKDKATSYYDPT